MKILVAPDSYKGSLSSKQVCQAIEEGLLKACQGVFEVVKVPLLTVAKVRLMPSLAPLVVS